MIDLLPEGCLRCLQTTDWLNPKNLSIVDRMQLQLETGMSLGSAKSKGDEDDEAHGDELDQNVVKDCCCCSIFLCNFVISPLRARSVQCQCSVVSVVPAWVVGRGLSLIPELMSKKE